jgi:HTH-type transcriptional repressor of NAD biosynthesis genes
VTTRGFLLGKFLPPHAGHLFLCEASARLCDELTVLVCTLDAEPIDGRLRFSWMKELLPHVRVVHYAKDVPQQPTDHPDFWAIWRKICREVHPEPPDYVFGSEAYVVRLAQELEARPILIDPERLAFPVSGAAVRENPVRHWEMLPGPIRSYYQKRVVVVGAESTGKSTLARDLAAHFSTRYVPEYGRVYDAFRTLPWSGDSFAEIEAGHAAMRSAISPKAGPLLFEDTDELVTRVWAHELTGAPLPPRARPNRQPDLYLLLDTDLAWRDDGTRYQGEPNFRERFQSSIRGELERSAVPWRKVAGTGSERKSRALTAIREVLGVAIEAG